MLPLAYGIGSGADMLKPLAIAVIGALCISVLLSLVATPTVYYLMPQNPPPRGGGEGILGGFGGGGWVGVVGVLGGVGVGGWFFLFFFRIWLLKRNEGFSLFLGFLNVLRSGGRGWGVGFGGGDGGGFVFI